MYVLHKHNSGGNRHLVIDVLSARNFSLNIFESVVLRYFGVYNSKFVILFLFHFVLHIQQ